MREKPSCVTGRSWKHSEAAVGNEILVEFHQLFSAKRIKLLCTAFKSRRETTRAELSMIQACYCYTLLPKKRARASTTIFISFKGSSVCTPTSSSNTVFPAACVTVSQPAAFHGTTLNIAAPFRKHFLIILLSLIFNLRFWKLCERGRFEVWICENALRKSVLDVQPLPPAACRSPTPGSACHHSQAGGSPEVFSTRERLQNSSDRVMKSSVALIQSYIPPLQRAEQKES